ncbi:MAG: hypothetical protein QNK90_15165 [Opitutaceae bacterium]
MEREEVRTALDGALTRHFGLPAMIDEEEEIFPATGEIRFRPTILGIE